MCLLPFVYPAVGHLWGFRVEPWTLRDEHKEPKGPGSVELFSGQNRKRGLSRPFSLFWRLVVSPFGRPSFTSISQLGTGLHQNQKKVPDVVGPHGPRTPVFSK